MNKMKKKLALVLVSILVFGYVGASAQGLTGYLAKYLAEYLEHRRSLIDIGDMETPLSSFDDETVESEVDSEDNDKKLDEEPPHAEPVPQESEPVTPLDEYVPDDEKPVDEETAEAPSEDETSQLVTPSVRVECIMDQVVKGGQEFILKATLVGFEGKQTKVQWQYKQSNEKEWHDAKDVENGAQSLQYRVKADKENLRMMWRVVVTVVA